MVLQHWILQINLTNCEQPVKHTHISGNRLDLLLTGVPGVVKSCVKPPLGYSDHWVIFFDLDVIGTCIFARGMEFLRYMTSFSSESIFIYIY